MGIMIGYEWTEYLRETRTEIRRPDDLRQMRWFRFPSGFHITEATVRLRTGSVATIDTIAPIRGKGDAVEYKPLEEEANLAFEFMEVKSKDSALRFANRFGRLGLDEYPQEQLGGGEMLDDWLDQARAVRSCVETWEAIEAGNSQALKGIVGWTNQGRIEGHFLGEHCRLGDLSDGPDGYWPRGDLLGPARELISSYINGELHGRISAELRFNSEKHARLVIVPTTLRAFIWLQVAEIV